MSLDAWYKPKIDRKTLKELSKRSDEAGIRHVVIYFAALLLKWVYGLYHVGYVVDGALVFCLWQHFAFSNAIQHETNHGTFFASPRLNLIFWHISSLYFPARALPQPEATARGRQR